MAEKKHNVNLDYLQRKIDEYGGVSEVARKMGYSKSLICLHYNGTRSVSIDSLVEYAKLFNVSTDKLLGLPTEESEEQFIDRVSDYTGLSTDVIQDMHVGSRSYLFGKCFDLVDFLNALWNAFSENSVLHDLNQETAIVEGEIRGTGYRTQRISSAIEQAKEKDISDLLKTLSTLSEDTDKCLEDSKYIREKYTMCRACVEFDIPPLDELDTYSLKKEERNLYGYLYESQRLFDTTLRAFFDIEGISEKSDEAKKAEIELEKRLAQFTDNFDLASTNESIQNWCVNFVKSRNEDYQK